MKPPSFLETQNTIPMNRDQSDVLITLIANARLDKIPYNEPGCLGELGETFQGRVFQARVPEEEQGKYSLALVAFLITISRSPGDIVLWLWTLHCWYLKKKKPSMLTLTDFVYEVIPNGLPSEAVMSDIWDKQKSQNGGNLLDLPATWEAPQPDKEVS